MYAIIETGGKQYRVEQGDVIDVELLKGAESGEVTFDHVLFLNDGSAIKVGAPYLKGGSVAGAIVSEIKGAKVFSYKYKKRKGYQRKQGHRQRYLRVKITSITG